MSPLFETIAIMVGIDKPQKEQGAPHLDVNSHDQEVGPAPTAPVSVELGNDRVHYSTHSHSYKRLTEHATQIFRRSYRRCSQVA